MRYNVLKGLRVRAAVDVAVGRVAATKPFEVPVLCLAEASFKRPKDIFADFPGTCIGCCGEPASILS